MTLRRLSFIASTLALITIPAALYASANAAKTAPDSSDCCADPAAGCCEPTSAGCTDLLEQCKVACEEAKSAGASCEEACQIACETVCATACVEPAASTCDATQQDACAGGGCSPVPAGSDSK